MEQQRGDGGNEMEARLLETIRARLVENGSLNQIKSELRAIVINDVREGDKSHLNSLDGGDGISHANRQSPHFGILGMGRIAIYNEHVFNGKRLHNYQST